MQFPAGFQGDTLELLDLSDITRIYASNGKIQAVTDRATFPAAYFMYWMPHSVSGFFIYFGIFFAIYFGIWVTQYTAAKKRIERINTEIQKIGN